MPISSLVLAALKVGKECTQGWQKHIQAGAELGQAQLKLELDFTLIFCRFGLSRFGLETSFWMVRKLVRLYLQSRFLHHQNSIENG